VYFPDEFHRRESMEKDGSATLMRAHSQFNWRLAPVWILNRNGDLISYRWADGIVAQID